MKAYTDIEQSKKLAEILPIESADGFYEAQLNPITDEWEYILFTGNEWASEEVVIPCWSLAALLDVIPKRVKDYNVLRIDIGDNDFAIWYDEIGYGVNNDLPNITAESAIDACVEMIYKLKEKDLI